ncbi:hypothetical protein SPRG_04873 [Saprolegnia parasitica CBS 223.65]|uniref:Uncharacterized protein n=1 Tax=Saprolegnia parasitica (strain CBS 223.65) TaxID=695850 RepID=A0A067CTA8_SAPPC|nr:hypothetical protein SPRG_04873 [Saprolegnia parasitica CBS 223.65]KDO29756.1 hypothetical protein SPRG_04873 [Saprolegnia parasitica CBS 223.65]|eukprot:XP_012199404.1 hypothetical protein SPRG_04873 [Saprolegnia parasitica CBS 223.65]
METTSSKNIESVDALNKCFRTLRMPKMTDDAASIRRDYMCQIGKIIDKQALTEAIKVKAIRRIAIKAITEKIEPAWVKHEVSRHLEVNPAKSLKALKPTKISGRG